LLDVKGEGLAPLLQFRQRRNLRVRRHA
jgi:hypothetical protein